MPEVCASVQRRDAYSDMQLVGIAGSFGHLCLSQAVQNNVRASDVASNIESHPSLQPGKQFAQDCYTCHAQGAYSMFNTAIKSKYTPWLSRARSERLRLGSGPAPLLALLVLYVAKSHAIGVYLHR